MKKLFSAIILSLLFAFGTRAQDSSCHFGFQGGVSLNKYTTMKEFKSNIAGWHAGITLLVKMPAFFAFQPAVLFERSNAEIPYDSGAQRFKVNTLNIPLAVQWGPDLGFCRIFAEAAPFVDINLAAKISDTDMRDSIKKAQFGIGAGAGIDIWRLQLKVRYNWGFGDWRQTTSSNPFKDLEGKKRGFTVTLAYLFN